MVMIIRLGGGGVGYGASPAWRLYSDTSSSGAQMASVAAKCSEESRSFMMAEKAGRSLKLHIQQYLIRSYLKERSSSFLHSHLRWIQQQCDTSVWRGLTKGPHSRTASSSYRTSGASAAPTEDPAQGTEQSLAQTHEGSEFPQEVSQTS